MTLSSERRAAVVVAGARGALRWGALDALLLGPGVAVVSNLVADPALPLLDPVQRRLP